VGIRLIGGRVLFRVEAQYLILAHAKLELFSVQVEAILLLLAIVLVIQHVINDFIQING
jgi:hypothetical protein